MPVDNGATLSEAVQSMDTVSPPIKIGQKKNQRFIPLALLPYIARLRLLR